MSDAAVLRAMERRFEFGPVSVDLSAAEVKLIANLAAGTATRAHLANELSGGTERESNGVDVSMSRLRSKLRSAGLAWIIEAAVGVGWSSAVPIRIDSQEELRPVIVRGDRADDLRKLLEKCFEIESLAPLAEKVADAVTWW